MITNVLQLLSNNTLDKMIGNLTRFKKGLSKLDRDNLEDVEASIDSIYCELQKRKDNDHDMFNGIS